jgi:hypothetical protein
MCLSGHLQNGHFNLVCQLYKSIYGLKQSPCVWHAKLGIALEVLGFTKSSINSSLFVRLGIVDKPIVLIYVDDLIITRNNGDSIAQLRRLFNNNFRLRTLVLWSNF